MEYGYKMWIWIICSEGVKLLNWNEQTNEVLFALNHVKIDIHPATPDSQQDSAAAIDQSLATVSHLSKRPWQQNGEELKPCWNTSPLSKLPSFMIK